MGVVREEDAISDAIIETEREIAGDAWDIEDTERLDASGDRALESMGDGLEGQIEQDPDESEGGDEDVDGEEDPGEGEGDEEEEADGEEGEEAEAGQAGQGNQAQQQQRREPEGRVPSGKLREANERARLAEDERDRLKTELEQAKTQGGTLAEIATLKAQIAELSRGLQQRPAPQAAEPPKQEAIPDIFENPTGFAEHLTKSFQSELAKRDQAMAAQRVETSMAIAHATHKEAFETAFGELNKLNPQNPDDRAVVQRIYSSPNPGEALVTWHKRATAIARVGNDPDAYEARIRQETRDALLKDPEFRKQLISDLRGEAQAGGANGGPRTETRLPRSLNRAAGSNVGGGREELRAPDGSEQAIAESAWRTS